MSQKNRADRKTNERIVNETTQEAASRGTDGEKPFLSGINRRQFLGGTAGAAASLFSLGATADEVASRSGTTTNVAAGHLHLDLKNTGDGIHVERLYDELGQRELHAEQSVPLWEIAMYNPENEDRAFFRADQHWNDTDVSRADGRVEMTWQNGEAALPASYGIPNQSLTIDGDVSELADTPGISITEDFDAWWGRNELGGTVWLTWDADHLYVAARVEDDDHVQTHDGDRTWHDDAMQVGVAGGKPGTVDTWDEFDIALTPDGPQVYHRVVPDGDVSRVLKRADVEIARDESVSETVYEVALPWDDLTASVDDDLLGTSVVFHDRDDDHETNTGWLEWGGGILGAKNTAEFVRSQLADTDEQAGPGAQAYTELDVTVTTEATPDSPDDALRWDISVENDSDWAVYETAFPQVNLQERDETRLFYPRMEGAVRRDTGENFRYVESYPAASRASLQYFGLYDPDETGLYVGSHDPDPAVKNFRAETVTGADALALGFFAPSPDMIGPGNDYELNGEGVWQLFEGDWYNAATIYRDWVREEAEWYPREKLGPSGREDTPEWQKELPVWLRFPTREDLERHHWDNMIRKAKEYQEFMDVPVGVHWYRWYKDAGLSGGLPDAYLSPKERFADGVEELHDAGIRVMPYINARLWDTGLESFSTEGHRGASMDSDGEFYTERYATEDPVAVMDPSTEVWQDKLHEICLQLFDEYDVDGVYLDQLDAPAYAHNDPTKLHPKDRELGDQSALCLDDSHDHPVGGGDWWTDGFQELLEEIRSKMPDDGILSSEHHAEMYTSGIDSGLVWSWGIRNLNRGGERAYDDRHTVPAVPAVYGGTIQYFGRPPQGFDNYPETRVKAATMLVYGNQMGWWPPRILYEEPLIYYLRRVTRLRYELTSYFHGEMARPPELDVPLYTIDWEHKGRNYPVTTRKVRAGAWKHPSEDSMVLVFTNPSEDAVTTQVDLDLKEYGMAGDLTVRKIAPDGPTGEEFSTARFIDREVTFGIKTAWAWEVVTGEGKDN